MNPNYWWLLVAGEDSRVFFRGVDSGTHEYAVGSHWTQRIHRDEEIGGPRVLGSPGGDERVGGRWIGSRYILYCVKLSVNERICFRDT